MIHNLSLVCESSGPDAQLCGYGGIDRRSALILHMEEVWRAAQLPTTAGAFCRLALRPGQRVQMPRRRRRKCRVGPSRLQLCVGGTRAVRSFVVWCA